MDVVRMHFRPEFLNRLDDILVFNRLTREDMASIVRIHLQSLKKRLSDSHQVTLEWKDGVEAWLAGQGYDPAYGARPLRRLLQRTLQDELATHMLKGDIAEHSLVTIICQNERIMLEIKEPMVA